MSFEDLLKVGLVGLGLACFLLGMAVVELHRIIVRLDAYRPGPSGRGTDEPSRPGEAHIPSVLLPWEQMVDDEE